MAPRALLPADGSASVGPASFDADVQTSVRNASKLGLSLIVTWGLGLAVRVVLPRHLGPALFGAYQFADALTAGLFTLISFGVETHVRRVLALRPAHALDFYAGLLLLRVVLGAVILGTVVAALAHAGRPPIVLRLVGLLAVMQFFVVENGTLAAMLHAVGRVNGLSVLNVTSKLVWGAGAIVALVAGWGAVGVAVAMLVSEALRSAGLGVIARRHLVIHPRVDPRATLAALVGGLPFFFSGLSLELMNRGTAALVSLLASDTELGWYGAAASVTGAAMLLAPLFGWVLLPLTARTESRSHDEFGVLVRRTMGLVLTAAVPITLLLTLGADVVVGVLFGRAFAPTVLSLRALAPMFLFTYIAMVSGGALIGAGRGWTVTKTSMCAVVITPALTWVLVPRCLAAFGPGGAGVGAAFALNVGEAVTAFVLTLSLGARAFDRPRTVMVAKMAVVCAAVVAMDRLALASYGIARLTADAAVYFALTFLWNAGDYPALIGFARRAVSRRAQPQVSLD